MAPHITWFLLAFGLLALEMATGTFTMLVLAIACGVGGLAALSGFGLPLQVLCAAVAGVIGTLVLRRSRRAAANAPDMQSLDLGQIVHGVVWRDDGRARVQYRGAEWDAELDPAVAAAGIPAGTPLYIVAIRGSRLVLSPRKP